MKRRFLKTLLTLLITISLASVSAFGVEKKDPIEEMVSKMTLREKIAQMMMLTFGSWDENLQDGKPAVNFTVMNEQVEWIIENYKPGAIAYFSQNLENTKQAYELTKAFQEAATQNDGIPMLICADQEGGLVYRLKSGTAMPGNMALGATANPDYSYIAGQIMGSELSAIGINTNLAPVVDVSTERTSFMYDRSLGQPADITSDFASNMVTLMDSYSLGSCLKHFPGYGNNPDTHTGMARDSRSLSQLEENDLLPFAAGIKAGCDAILVSHTVVECFDPETPASLSPAVHDYLRETMGFEGVIVTDDLVMQAITDTYGAGEAAVLAVLAGNDLLCSTEYTVQYEAVLDAVLDGRIDIDTLNNAVRRVLQWKINLGLI